MTNSLYYVPIETLTRRFTVVVRAISSIDARLKAIDIVNRIYNLPVAHWEQGMCGRWVRGRLAGLPVDTPIEDRHDGFLCAIDKPEWKEEMQ